MRKGGVAIILCGLAGLALLVGRPSCMGERQRGGGGYGQLNAKDNLEFARNGEVIIYAIGAGAMMHFAPASSVTIMKDEQALAPPFPPSVLNATFAKIDAMCMDDRWLCGEIRGERYTTIGVFVFDRATGGFGMGATSADLSAEHKAVFEAMKAGLKPVFGSKSLEEFVVR